MVDYIFGLIANIRMSTRLKIPSDCPACAQHAQHSSWVELMPQTPIRAKIEHARPCLAHSVHHPRPRVLGLPSAGTLVRIRAMVPKKNDMAIIAFYRGTGVNLPQEIRTWYKRVFFMEAPSHRTSSATYPPNVARIPTAQSRRDIPYLPLHEKELE